MRAVVAIAVIAFAAYAVAQPHPIRPQISETFEGEGYTHITTPNETIWGLGRWVIDEPNGHALEFWEFNGEHRHHSVNFLKRFDLGFEYAIAFHHYPTPHRTCTKRAVKPPMPPAWAWVHDARYHGKHVIDGTTFDLWGHHFGGMDLEVAVSEHDASRPHYFMRRTPTEHRSYHLISWHTFKPNATWFNVPDVCKNATEEMPAMALGEDGNDQLVATCSAAAEQAQRIVTQSNGYSASSLVASAFNRAGVSLVRDIDALYLSGAECEGGARVGDVFFDGVPATSAAVYLGGNSFAECPVSGGRCAIVEFRDFSAGCRRFC